MTSREFKYHRNKKARKEDGDDWDMAWNVSIKRNPNDRICEDEGCSHFADVKCVLDYFDEDTKEWKEQVEWLCCEHAEKAGFCMGCGTFIAGTGMEYRNNGYCDNCFDEIADNDWEEDNDWEGEGYDCL